jgi:hypothetical protein
MRTLKFKSAIIAIAILLASVCGISYAQQSMLDQPPVNLSGTWTVYANNINKAGSSLKTLTITQNGNIVSGRFKGPNQSGKIQGWVNGNHFEISTDTREVLTFRGNLQNNMMTGLYGIQGRHAEFRGERAN